METEMFKSIKKTQKAIVKTVFLAVYPVFLFAACQNGFLNDAAESLNPLPVVVAPIAGIDWGSKNERVLYIDPRGGTMAGTLSGRLNNGGNKIWFVTDQSNPQPKKIGYTYGKWELVAPADEENITPEFLTAAIGSGSSMGGTPSATPDAITLAFGTFVDFVADYFATPGQNYSFILYPSAFTGADSNKLSTEAATLNFTVETPTATNYAKRLVEKAEYPVITVSWSDGNSLNGSNPIEGMKQMGGSLAASLATNVLESYLKLSGGSIGEASFDPDAGSFSTGLWLSVPDLAKGYWDGNGAFRLDGFYIDAEPFVKPEISVPIKFTSDVGSAVALIQKAEAAGSFSYSSAGSSDIWNYVAGSIVDLAGPLFYGSGSILGGTPTMVWSPSYSSSVSLYTVTITLDKGNDNSPGDKFSIKVNN
jgi:hypothetical protein